jgi:hypothetical protein
MHKRIAVAAAAALAACGGSSWVDPTSGTFTTQDTTDVMATISASFGVAVQQQPASQPLAQARRQVAVNPPPQACAISGDVTVTGDMSGSCSPSGTSCNFGGQLHLALNSCSSVTGVVANGGLDIGASGSTNGNAFSLHETIQGGITVTRDGTLVGTCGINVTVDISSDGTTETVHVSGTVCKRPVTQ